ncbi:hypothetical protein [Candidatus Magnetominusculus dajiuhuensis]|uniref:hypothetical protein n=1 Tax=Candidatus Magnetominusculus dajiuhuensis TaxID=3137712 RepID=UPI003B4286F4
MLTPQGSAEQDIFSLRITLSNLTKVNVYKVFGSKLKEQGFIALIGRDILKHCVFVYNGTTGSCSPKVEDFVNSVKRYFPMETNL